jgi:lipoprotein NlpI
LIEYNKAAGYRQSSDMFIHRELVSRRLRQTRSLAELAKSVATWKHEWSKTVGLYLVGTTSEAELLAQAEQTDPSMRPYQTCEAFYYAGLIHSLAGDAEGARQLLKQSVATNLRHKGEWVMARAELARLSEKVSDEPKNR